MPVRARSSSNARTSSPARARPCHCTWFFKKICTTPQPTSAPRSRARGSPPAIDMWAPRLSRSGGRASRGARLVLVASARWGGEAAPDRAATPAAGRLVELPGLGEDLLRVGELTLPVPLDEPDDPLPVDHEGRSETGVQLGPVDAVLLDDLSVDVAEQRIGDPAQRLRPRLVAV